MTKDGQIVTNAHVVDGATSITVKLASGQTRTASLVGKDDSTDVALLKISTSGLGVAPLQLADSSKVQVGDATAAIGNPYGLDRTLTTGVVSAVHRTIQAPNGFSIPNAIQTDAALNPGNSGGPLLDANGAVIGINSQIYADNQGSAASPPGRPATPVIGFAVPSSTVSRVVAQLRSGGKAEHAYLGVQLAADAAGARVAAVTSGGAADEAGVRKGDVITAVDGTTVDGAEALSAAIDATARRAGPPDGPPRRLDPDADRQARHPPVLDRDGRMTAAAPPASGRAGALSPGTGAARRPCRRSRRVRTSRSSTTTAGSPSCRWPTARRPSGGRCTPGCGSTTTRSRAVMPSSTGTVTTWSWPTSARSTA